MSKAEETHYKAVIAADNQEPPKDYAISAHADHFNGFVEGFVEGYQQAEKDFSLTSDDINDIIRIYEDVLETKSGENIYIEVLNRFNKQKEYGKV